MRENIRQTDEFEVWPENAPLLELFVAVQTQWRQGPIGPSGLDYSGVETALRLMGVKIDAEMFGFIRLMERAALDCFAKARNNGT